MSDLPDGGNVEQLARSRGYLLLADEVAFSIWDVHGDDEHQVEEFERTDEGSEAAWERFRELAAEARWRSYREGLVWAAAIVGAAWIVLTILVGVLSILATGDSASDGLFTLWRYIELGVSVAEPAFIVLVGLYVVLWMRDHREPVRRR